MKTEWIVTETSPYSGEEPVVTAHRSVEEAREAVCSRRRTDATETATRSLPTRKETDMNKLKNEARAIIENYDPKADFEETILKLASIGYKMEEAMMHT